MEMCNFRGKSPWAILVPNSPLLSTSVYDLVLLWLLDQLVSSVQTDPQVPSAQWLGMHEPATESRSKDFPTVAQPAYLMFLEKYLKKKKAWFIIVFVLIIYAKTV